MDVRYKEVSAIKDVGYIKVSAIKDVYIKVSATRRFPL